MQATTTRPKEPAKPPRQAPVLNTCKCGVQSTSPINHDHREPPQGVARMLTANCPRCRTRLDGGPVVFRCSHCRRAVQAADLDLEFRPTRPLTRMETPA